MMRHMIADCPLFHLDGGIEALHLAEDLARKVSTPCFPVGHVGRPIFFAAVDSDINVWVFVIWTVWLALCPSHLIR